MLAGTALIWRMKKLTLPIGSYFYSTGVFCVYFNCMIPPMYELQCPIINDGYELVCVMVDVFIPRKDKPG